MKNVTIKDVARVAGVSYSTVSRALSGSPEISESTRQRILRVCKEMHYTANTVARAMVMKSTKLLGLILPGVNNPFMSELAYHIDRQARARGYNIILCNSSRDLEQERALFELMIGRQVDGVILLPVGPESYQSLQPYLSRLPTVFVGENLRDAQESYVSVDNYRGAYMGVEYLYGLGHRDILYFGCRPGSVTHQLRADGYAAACQDLGLAPQFCNSPFSSTSIQYGCQLAKQLFAQERRFTAIFASTDANALGIMEAAEECGIPIPDALSLLGFDNISYSGLPRIGLTTVEQPMRMLSSVAVDSLLEKVQNELAGYTHRILTPALIERASCKPVVPRQEGTGADAPTNSTGKDGSR